MMDRWVAFERLHNFRDVGGYRATGGRTVRGGLLYRSDSLGKLRDADLTRFMALGVRTVIDLRYPWEIDANGRVPQFAGLRYHNLSVEHRPYNQAAMPVGVDPARLYADKHAEVARDGVKELAAALAVIAAAGDAPTVVHCASGKDRTGLLVALVLSLLGVAREDIVADYALTNQVSARLVADWCAARHCEPPRWPGFGRAPAEAMRLFLDELSAAHGSVRAYARDRLGADDALVTALRGRLLAARA